MQPSMGQVRMTCCGLVNSPFLFGFLLCTPDFLDVCLAVVLVGSSDGGRFNGVLVTPVVRLVQEWCGVGGKITLRLRLDEGVDRVFFWQVLFVVVGGD